MRAMVLAAGYGTRLGDLTQDTPKPMLDICGRPMVEYILVNLVRHGFTDIVMNLHFKPDSIREFFGDGSRLGARITYSHEPQLLGTAGGVKKMEAYLGEEENFLVHYGDVITDQDLCAMMSFHRSHEGLATLLLHERARSNSVVALDSNRRITGFLERPTEEQRRTLRSPWVNSGVCICRRELLSHIPAGTPCDLPRDIFVPLIENHALYGFPLDGYRCAVDSPQRLEQVRAAIAGGETSFGMEAGRV